MIEDILNNYPNQKIFQANIPLLFAIFDFNDKYSLEILFSILTSYLHYSEGHATKLIEKYMK